MPTKKIHNEQNMNIEIKAGCYCLRTCIVVYLERSFPILLSPCGRCMRADNAMQTGWVTRFRI